MTFIKRFLKEQDGQDGVEYALLIGFVSVAIVATATTFTGAFNTFWTNTGGAVTLAATKASGLK